MPRLALAVQPSCLHLYSPAGRIICLYQQAWHILIIGLLTSLVFQIHSNSTGTSVLWRDAESTSTSFMLKDDLLKALIVNLMSFFVVVSQN